jgi:hypothetical protein
VDARRGAAEVLGSWSMDRAPDGVWLGADLDGQILFSLSSSEAGMHSVLRYEIDRRTLSRLVTGSSSLAAPVLADANGFVIYTATRESLVGRRFEAEGAVVPMNELWSWR